MNHAVAVCADERQVFQGRMALLAVRQCRRVMALDEVFAKRSVAGLVVESAYLAGEPPCVGERLFFLHTTQHWASLANAVLAIADPSFSRSCWLLIRKQL